jgi:hypothetical protein
MKSMLATAVIVLLAGTPALAQWGYAPVMVAPAPTVAYYAPPAYYAPAPVPMVTYYGPGAVYAYPPAVWVRPRVIVAPAPVVIVPRYYVPGEPVRNVLRAVF